MEGAFSEVASHLIKTYGLAGIVILVQGLVIWRLVKRDEARQAKLDLLMEKRVEEAKESTEALNANTTSLNRMVEFFKDVLRPTLPGPTR